MFKMKKILITILLSVFVVLPLSVRAEDIYDVVLFWGQSNMRGAAGSPKCKNKVDENLGGTTEGDLDDFSYRTGIHKFILQNYETIDYVSVPFNKNSAYEFLWLNTNNHLRVFTKDTKNVGETVYTTKNNGKFSFSSTGTVKQSFSQSLGTNVSLWFSKTYYERTKHKVIVVMAARNGVKMNNFLPSTDPDYKDSENKYLYEAMTSKYKAAIDYLEKHNYKIGNRIDVVFQGESDVGSRGGREKGYWTDMYQKVHNYMKKELKLDFSVIIYTAGENGYEESLIKMVHESQENAIKNNSDVILGSDFVYKHFAPKNSDYIEEANLITAAQCDNSVHYTAAALSQVGYETAKNAANYVLKTITFDSNGGTPCTTSSSTKAKNSTWDNLCVPTRAGYVFTGWNTKKDGTGKTITKNTKVESSLTVYAQWKSNKIKVTFDCNGGTGGGVQTFTYGVKNQMFTKTCTRNGYKFVKWSKNNIGSDGSYKLDCSVSDDWIVKNSPTVTLYAIWGDDSRAMDVDDIILDGTEEDLVEDKTKGFPIIYVAGPITIVIVLLVLMYVKNLEKKKPKKNSSKKKTSKKTKKK